VTDILTAALIGGGAAIVGGVIGGLLSGAYQHIRDHASRPRLQIDYEGVEGAHRVEVDYTDKENRPVAEIYIRARVQNKGRRVAKGCLVFLANVREVHPSGMTTTSFHDSMPLAWAGWNFSPRDIPRGVEFYVDVVRVSKHVSGWRFSVERLFASHAELKDYRGTYRFSLMVTGDKADPAMCEVDVTYDGDWHNLRAVAVGARR
jgi:hypothetical protein